MVRPALLPVALVRLVVLAGCSGAAPGLGPATTPADIDASIVETASTGGQCVDNPSNGVHVESIPSDDGTRTVTVSANITVPGAHYIIDESPTLTSTDADSYRLDVNTTESSEKPAKDCERGGIVHYEVTLEAPDTNSFELQSRHNGRPVSGVGPGGET